MPVCHWERHRTKRIGWLRAAVLGANDGILSTASLVLCAASRQAAAHDRLGERLAVDAPHSSYARTDNSRAPAGAGEPAQFTIGPVVGLGGTLWPRKRPTLAHSAPTLPHPRASRPRGPHQFRSGAEAGRGEQTRSRCASKAATLETVSLSPTGLNGVNGVTRNRWVFLSH